ncbi:hypothetical protein Xinn_04077 [Xenorhabdus innexi]|uniref:Uncharacterized protein n=1 Tax=Xenorhabdus innexi TaxID=290109 RepID=A0A2G0MP81_9GAMM|nr:hypothetical protein Xinn_04077 [Xenorhabdus innexi]
MAHLRVGHDFRQDIPGSLAEGSVFTATGFRNRLQPAGIEGFRIAAGQRFIVLGIDIAPDPPVVITDPFAQTQPAGYSQHQ